MLDRSDYLPVGFEEEDDENVFVALYSTETETASKAPEASISEKLDTIIEYESKIHYALWSVIAVISFIVVVRLLWTVFDKWFFGGV